MLRDSYAVADTSTSRVYKLYNLYTRYIHIGVHWGDVTRQWHINLCRLHQVSLHRTDALARIRREVPPSYVIRVCNIT